MDSSPRKPQEGIHVVRQVDFVSFSDASGDMGESPGDVRWFAVKCPICGRFAYLKPDQAFVGATCSGCGTRFQLAANYERADQRPAEESVPSDSSGHADEPADERECADSQGVRWTPEAVTSEDAGDVLYEQILSPLQKRIPRKSLSYGLAFLAVLICWPLFAWVLSMGVFLSLANSLLIAFLVSAVPYSVARSRLRLDVGCFHEKFDGLFPEGTESRESALGFLVERTDAPEAARALARPLGVEGRLCCEPARSRMGVAAICLLLGMLLISVFAWHIGALLRGPAPRIVDDRERLVIAGAYPAGLLESAITSHHVAFAIRCIVARIMLVLGLLLAGTGAVRRGPGQAAGVVALIIGFGCAALFDLPSGSPFEKPGGPECRLTGTWVYQPSSGAPRVICLRGSGRAYVIRWEAERPDVERGEWTVYSENRESRRTGEKPLLEIDVGDGSYIWCLDAVDSGALFLLYGGPVTRSRVMYQLE